METIDLLDGVKAQRDEQRRRYLIAYGEALKLGNLAGTEQEEFERIDKKFRDLFERSKKKETKLEPLREQNQEEYVAQMVELCDEEAKVYSTLTGELRKLVHEVGLRRGSMSLSNMGLKRTE